VGQIKFLVGRGAIGEPAVRVTLHDQLHVRNPVFGPPTGAAQFQVGRFEVRLVGAGLVHCEAERRNARGDLGGRDGITLAVDPGRAGIPLHVSAKGVKGDYRLDAQRGIPLELARNDRSHRVSGKSKPAQVDHRPEGRVRDLEAFEVRDHRADCVDTAAVGIGGGLLVTRQRAVNRGHEAVTGQVLGRPPERTAVATEPVLKDDYRAGPGIGHRVGGAEHGHRVSRRNLAGIGLMAKRGDREVLPDRSSHPRKRIRGRSRAGIVTGHRSVSPAAETGKGDEHGQQGEASRQAGKLVIGRGFHGY
jgi:hypothetical protein